MPPNTFSSGADEACRVIQPLVDVIFGSPVRNYRLRLKEALVELVLRLLERVAALEAEVAQLRQPPKTPTNSSVPPSQG